MKKEIKCENCKYWKDDLYIDFHKSDLVGWCKRFPIAEVKLRKDFCGEFKEKYDK